MEQEIAAPCELQSDVAGVVARPMCIGSASTKSWPPRLDRAIWALDLARAMGDVKEGNFERARQQP